MQLLIDNYNADPFTSNIAIGLMTILLIYYIGMIIHQFKINKRNKKKRA